MDAAYGGADEPVLFASIYWEQDRASWLRWMWWYNPPPEPGAAGIGAGSYEPPGGAAITGARLEGNGVADEYIAFDQVEEIGVYQPVIVADYNISGEETVTPAARVAFAASQAVQGMQSGSILVPVHPGLELWDRLQITDPRACYSPMARRCAGVETYYDKRGKRLKYEQVVFLWGVEPW